MLRAFVISIALFINLIFWGALILSCGLVKLVTFGRVRRRVILITAALAESWDGVNQRIFDTFLDTRWEIEGVDGLRRDAHYLVISNHASWVDIFAVLRALHHRAPFIRFFIKSTLRWAPIIGQAAWALDFPFMRRYSPEYLKEHPEKRGTDLETTRTALRRYRGIPVSIVNYVEGTRLTRAKHEEQQSPYRYLLKPRVGGIGFVLASFAEQLEALLDITIVYPKRNMTMLDLVMNRVPWIRVVVRQIEVPPELCSDAITQRGEARDRFREWVEQIWREKDETIGRILESHR